MADRTVLRPAAEERAALLAIVREKGYSYSPEGFQLSSGGTSHDYVDMRRAVGEGDDLRVAAHAVIATLDEHAVVFDAIGGMTMGADPVSHAVALLSGSSWYSVRKAEKDHGTRNRVEGSRIGEGSEVIVFEDTTSTGRSLLEALDVVEASGASIAACCTLLDRGEATRSSLAARGVPYYPLLDYRDLGIEPLGGASPETSATASS